MWYLTSSSDERVIYIVPLTNQVTIGRSVDNEVCTFAIPDDPSISRKHATLSLTNNSLLLQDLGSRYGTFINESTDKVDVNINIPLKNNDIVKFGKMQSIWKVNSGDLITCTSTLKGENLQNLKVILSKVGGILKNEWDDSCNYLTMPDITLTIKVVLALVQGAHIITTDFWQACLDKIESQSHLPDPAQFTPRIKESTLNKEIVSFLPNSSRKTLFAGKKFIFFSRRQYEMYKPVLIKSSASPLLLSECKMSISMLCNEDVVVIQYVLSGASQETQSQKNQINDIVQSLKNKGVRVVADAEIGLAILYCTTEKYCNPYFNFTSEVVKQAPAQPAKQSVVLAHESQEQGPNVQRDNIQIDASFATDESNAERISAKRKLGEFTSDAENNSNKKLATSCLIANIKTESTKRRLSEEDDTNPSKKVATEECGAQKNNDFFNFITGHDDCGNQNINKKLNLLKPQKRKLDGNKDDDGLFNFIENDDESKSNDDSKQGMFSVNRSIQNEEDEPVPVKKNAEINIDVAAMRGAKLKELMERNITNGTLLTVKKENTEELLEKMNKLDLGNTIVIPCNDLIVKKEPLYDVSEISCANTSVKNFKKFKKVWPVRKQNSLIQSSIMESHSLTFTAA